MVLPQPPAKVSNRNDDISLRLDKLEEAVENLRAGNVSTQTSLLSSTNELKAELLASTSKITSAMRARIDALSAEIAIDKPEDKASRDSISKLASTFEAQNQTLQSTLSSLQASVSGAQAESRNVLADVQKKLDSTDPEIPIIKDQLDKLIASNLVLMDTIRAGTDQNQVALNAQTAAAKEAIAKTNIVLENFETLKHHLTMVISDIKTQNSQVMQDLSASVLTETRNLRDTVSNMNEKIDLAEIKRGQVESSILAKIDEVKSSSSTDPLKVTEEGVVSTIPLNVTIPKKGE